MKRYTESQRKEFISQFQHSNLTAVAFCRARGFSTVSLALWRKRYAKTQQSIQPARPSLRGPAPGPWVPVVVRDDVTRPPQGACYVLISDTGRLEVPRGFDAQEVGALWQVLTAVTAVTHTGVAS
jgi:hypothetical protein